MVSALPQPLLLRPFASAVEEDDAVEEEDSFALELETDSFTEEEDSFALELETDSFTEEEDSFTLELETDSFTEEEDGTAAELETGGTTAEEYGAAPELDSVTAVVADDNKASPELLCAGGTIADALLCPAGSAAELVASAPLAELSDSQLMNTAAVAAARTVKILDFI